MTVHSWTETVSQEADNAADTTKENHKKIWGGNLNNIRKKINLQSKNHPIQGNKKYKKNS